MITATRKPDLESANTRAWLVPEAEGHPTTVACWLLDAPWAHPFWQEYTVCLVRLCDVEGYPPAMRRYPSASHELQIIALDPEKTMDPDNPRPIMLMPPNLIYQFDGLSEHDCVRLVHLCVKTIVDGHMSPDSDYRQVWERALVSTVQHFKEGRHPAC